MRIISGKSRGTNLYTLEGNNTRPTLDRAKESLFNIISRDVVESNFLDLFSGSGAIGLEAVSRGAKKSILCDKSNEAIKIIKKNVEKMKAENDVEIYNLDFQIVLNEKITEKQNIIFLDPPYATDFAVQAVNIIIANDLLVDKGIIIIETDNLDEITKKLDSKKIKIIDNRKYGRANFLFLTIDKGSN